MGFTELEAAGKKALEQFPVIKRSAKRVYQVASVITNKDRVKAEGNIVRVSPADDYEYYYGYYDKSPWDASGRYMICLRASHTNKSVAPHRAASVCLIDTEDNNRLIIVGVSYAWNVQQGCMAQWLGPDFESRIIYNGFINGAYCSTIYNVKEMKVERVLPMPVYDVSRDGKTALSLDFNRLHRMRPGYGYSNMPDITNGILCPDRPCIWKMDLETGETEPLLKYTDFASFEHDPSMEGAEHKVNHLMISPNGKRFMVLHRWFQKGRKHTRLVTVNMDGTDMYNLSDDVFVSHCYWKNDEEILSFLRKKETGDHYYLMKDKTQEYRMFWPELKTDGHCSYSPDGKFIITDTYPNRKRIASVYLCTEEDNRSRLIARVFSPFKYDNDCRCDLHPRWSRDGRKICIDSVHEGKRGLYVLDVTEATIKAEKEKTLPLDTRKKIIYFVTRLRKSGPIGQTLDLIRNLDQTKYRPIVVSLYIETEEDTMIEEFLAAGAEYRSLAMRRVDSIIKGGAEAAKLFKELKPDLIHSVGMPLYKIARHYKGCPNFTTIHNYVFEDYPVKYGKFIGNGMAIQDILLIMRNADKMVTCSESLSKIYHCKHNVDIDFIRNGVDADRYSIATEEEKMALREKLNLPEDKLIAVFTGQVTPRKNQRFAVECFSKLDRDDVCLVLLGDGSDLEPLKEEYGRNGRIIFAGKVSNVAEYLNAADFYVSSSTSEGLPVGALEAMASGLPLLLSDIIQHKEVIHLGKNIGEIFINNDYESFKARLDILLSKDLKECGKECREVVCSDLSAKGMAEKYEAKYEKLIGGKHD